MKVLMTGHHGYIGSVMAPMFRAAGHTVVGLDTFLYENCDFGDVPGEFPAVRIDLRDVRPEHLEGFDAVVHLAALSNDPLGNFNPQITWDINHAASVTLARAAKAAGVSRYLYASSCSVYGVVGDDRLVDEEAAFNPVTAYGESKVKVEADVSKLADDTFSPTYMRNATAYGASPRLRMDLVVNSLVGHAVATGDVLIQSDGTPWRPLVHIEDISRAFLAVLHAPRELIHNQAFNVGLSTENYRIREVADIVQDVVPGSRVRYAEGGGPDLRCYRVSCEKIALMLPEYQPKWTVRKGVEQLYIAYRQHGFSEADLTSNKYLRIKRIRHLQGEGKLDNEMRWLIDVTAPVPADGILAAR